MRGLANVFLVAIVGISMFIVLPKGVDAHILRTDGSIGAVLHIDPEDDPIAKEQSYFFFEFKDKKNKLAPDNCDCTASILEDGKEIYSQPLYQNNQNPSLSNASFSYTFPERNVYIVKVVGKPTVSNEFQPFTLTYDIRVSRESNASSNQNTANNAITWISSHVMHLFGMIAIIVFFIVALIRQRFSQ